MGIGVEIKRRKKWLQSPKSKLTSRFLATFPRRVEAIDAQRTETGESGCLKSQTRRAAP
jgi:hypothetical protein